jgi:hypothetical protein
VVRLHAREIAVESEEGNGTRFTTTLPQQFDAATLALDSQDAAISNYASVLALYEIGKHLLQMVWS